MNTERDGNIGEDDMIVLICAIIMEYGVDHTINVSKIKSAHDMIMAGDGLVKLAFVPLPGGEVVAVSCLAGKTQINEWVRLGMTSKLEMN